MEALGRRSGRLLRALRDVDTRDKLLIAAFMMQTATLYFAWAAFDEAESAKYAAYEASDNSRKASLSCNSAEYDLRSVKDAADKASAKAQEAASMCHAR